MPGAAPVAISAGYRRYALGLLLVVFLVNYIDRQILAILLPAIKADLDLSDTQLGFLTGLAFAIFYATMGIPLGRIADRWNRRNLIVICLALWSLMTVLCGFAVNFMYLTLARIGVSVGEAGSTPASHSLIADFYPPQGRATALAVYNLGIPIGVLLGFAAGGWLNEFFGWRMAFIAVGLPGIALAVVVRLTLAEPHRGAVEGMQDDQPAPRLGEIASYLWQHRSYRHILLGASFTGVCYLALMQWSPSFLARSFGLGTGQIGLWLAPAIGLCGAAGTFLGGYLADRLRRRDLRWTAWLPGMALAISVVPAALALSSTTHVVAVSLLTVPLFLYPLHLAPFSALIQGMATLRMRSILVAISLFIANMIGLGLGPQIVGISSDLLASRYGSESLRYALLGTTALFGLWAALHFFLGARTLPEDLKAARRSAGHADDLD